MFMIIFLFHLFVNCPITFFTLYTKKQGMFLYTLHNPCFSFSFFSDSGHYLPPLGSDPQSVIPYTLSFPRF